MACTLLLVDDHTLIRAGVQALVADLPGYRVIGEASDGNQALALMAQLRPDIVLLDLSMKRCDGLQTLAAMGEAAGHGFPPPRVLILSMHIEPSLVLEALDAGADGYLLKDTTADELELALETVVRGERYLSPAVAQAIVDQALEQGRPATASGEVRKLTARQLETLRLIARGKSTREIATGLGLSVKTVETHRGQLMKRLQIFDVAGLVLFAIREGIISLDD